MTGLRKSQKIDLADTNCALMGSEVDKEVKLHAAQTEKAWKGIGKEVGIRVWRIEQFQVKEVPKETYGTFYTGDSYIVLNTFKVDDKFHHDVHFWLGLETTQDEAGTAAYKTVELDDFLAGLPVQHREVQGFETSKFLSYFPIFKCMEGGVASGFRTVKKEDMKPRLFQVSGNRGKSLVVRQVLCACSSLNEGDVFILDTGNVIYQWNGKQASGQEKHKSMTYCRALSSDRKGAKVQVLDQNDPDTDVFFEYLGGKGSISPPVDSKSPQSTSKVLLHVSDSSGALQVKEIARDNQISTSLLKSDDVFILDSEIEIFVWVGSKASKEEKSQALGIAIKYLQENNRPPTTRISRVLEGGHNSEFISLLK